MPAIIEQPDNINFLSPLGFKFTLRRSPTLNFFLTDINIPSVMLGFIETPTPFKIIEFPGDRLDFGDLQITFKVDEKMENYLEIFNWLVALGFPEDYKQYKKLADKQPGDKEGIYSDATLTVLNSVYVPILEIKFEDIFPIAIGDIDFTTTDSDINYVTNTATFKYKVFTITKL